MALVCSAVKASTITDSRATMQYGFWEEVCKLRDWDIAVPEVGNIGRHACGQRLAGEMQGILRSVS